jgi:ornithine--oxo-acid transaminase
MATTLVQQSTPETHAQQFIDLEEQYGAHNYHPLNVVIERAEGVWLIDVAGKRYLDCLAAYSAVNQGHCHPRILAAMVEQASKVALTSRAFRNDQLPLLYRDLHVLTGYDRVLMMNSGTEAVESAIKIARKWAYTHKGVPEGQAEIIVCSENFHGRTITIVGFSSEAQYRDGFGPYPTGFRTIPFGDADALHSAITPNTAAFLVEPIQGEAGVVLPPDGFLERASAICEEQNVLFIADEIQSGLGRTGKLFAHMHAGIRPDVLILGKALSGGFYPVSAVLASDEVMGVLHPGDHGSTFGGNPLACAVAREALSVIVDEKLAERSEELGTLFLQKLNGLRSPVITRVRGRGLWLAIELNAPARPFCEALQEAGLLCKETHTSIIRIAPPLTITRDEVLWAVDRIAAVLQ